MNKNKDEITTKEKEIYKDEITTKEKEIYKGKNMEELLTDDNHEIKRLLSRRKIMIEELILGRDIHKMANEIRESKEILKIIEKKNNELFKNIDQNYSEQLYDEFNDVTFESNIFCIREPKQFYDEIVKVLENRIFSREELIDNIKIIERLHKKLMRLIMKQQMIEKLYFRTRIHKMVCEMRKAKEKIELISEKNIESSIERFSEKYSERFYCEVGGKLYMLTIGVGVSTEEKLNILEDITKKFENLNQDYEEILQNID